MSLSFSKTMIQTRAMAKQVSNRVRTITLFAMVILTMVNNPHAKPKLENGFYTVEKRLDGNMFVEKLDYPVKSMDIRSSNNANSLYSISIVFKNIKKPKKGYFGLIANSVTKISGSSGSNSNTHTFSLHFGGITSSEMKIISKLYSILPLNNYHPRHKIKVSFTPVNKYSKSFESVKVIFRIKNTGMIPVVFMKGGAYQGSNRNNRFSFRGAYKNKKLKDIGSSNNFGGISSEIIIKPGESYTDTLILNKWFRFDRPSIHKITGFYSIAYYKRKAIKIGDSLYSRKIWSEKLKENFEINID